MPRTLVLFAHADPTATPPVYASAIAGRDVEIRFFVSHFSGLSAAYDALAAHLMTDGRILPGLCRYAGAADLASYDRVVLASWSAGYKMIEHLLDVPDDAAAIAGWVAMDSGYGPPSPGVIGLAKRARAGSALYFAGHTEIATPYESTGAFLADVEKAVGGQGGRFKFDDWGGTAAADHVAALREHGPVLLASALDALASSADEAPASTDPAPCQDDQGDTLGQRSLAIALGELAAGVHEVPGPAANPRIKEYLSGCVRGGRGLGLVSDEIAWCAAFASWCAIHAASAGEQPPHLWRASVAELWADAAENSATIEKHPIGIAQPNVGDLAIWGRNGGDPRKGGQGHVGRIETANASGFTTIEGNHGDAVARVAHSYTEPELVGWIRY